MKVESLTLSDVEEVKEVIRVSFLESVAPSWSESAINDFLNYDLTSEKLNSLISSGYVCLKSTEGKSINGVILFSSETKLGYLFVTPDSYGQSVAKTLFSSAKMLLSSATEYISLTSTEHAVPAYERLGFVKVSQPFKYNGCVFQPMAYWLGNDRLMNQVEFIS